MPRSFANDAQRVLVADQWLDHTAELSVTTTASAAISPPAAIDGKIVAAMLHANVDTVFTVGDNVTPDDPTGTTLGDLVNGVPRVLTMPPRPRFIHKATSGTGTLRIKWLYSA